MYVDAGDTLNVDLVEALLLEFGEYERAQNPQLLRDMVQAASGGVENGRLDVPALVRALTSDVREHWRVGCEDDRSTYAQDVLGVDPVQAQKQVDPQSRAFEMQSIDYVVDQHTSLLIVGVTWTFFLLVRTCVFLAQYFAQIERLTIRKFTHRRLDRCQSRMERLCRAWSKSPAKYRDVAMNLDAN